MSSAHAVIWLLLFASIWLAACSSVLQHLTFQTHKRRTSIGNTHIWGTRGLIALAFVNRGLGLKFAGEGADGKSTAHGVAAGAILLARMGVTLFMAGWVDKIG
jgi:hypothetical protein